MAWNHIRILNTSSQNCPKHGALIMLISLYLVTSRGALTRRLPYRSCCTTVTYDNGREFTDHPRLSKELKADIYFAHPYSSWERGTNENTNGLIRQFFPKNTSLVKVSKHALQLTMDRLNHRPRKTLNYRTPHEVFYNLHQTLTVALKT